MSLQSLVTLCVVLLSGSYAQNVQVSFTTNSPVAGRFVTATCTVTNLQPSQTIVSITWRHNGSTIMNGGRFMITNPSSGTSELTIEDLVPSDAGQYVCFADLQNPELQLSSSPSTLVIQTLPTVTADPEQVAVEGETAILRCNATSDARITWYRGPEGSEVELEVQMSSDPDIGIWTRDNVQGSDAGRYRCEGENSVGTASAEIQLVVLIPPNITNDVLVGHAVDKGSDLVLDCNATGVRDPTYTWFFNGQNLTVVNDERIQVNQSTGVLIVRETVFFDYGNYTCFAANEVGNDTQDNTIVIQGSPEIVTPLNESVITDIIVGVGEVAEFRCNFIAYPTPNTRWFRVTGQMRDELDVNANGRYQVGENGTLQLMNVRAGDAGMYSCEVANEFGNDTRMQNLMIIEPPISPSNLFQTVVDEDRFSLLLNWTQHPAPSQNREVGSFVVELSTDGGTTFQQSEQRFPSNVTSGVLMNLIPGETFSIRLRALNLGGLSPPSNVVSYTTPDGPPRLESFNAVAQDGGRSVLLEWELEYDGGREANTIVVEVYRNSVLIETPSLPIAPGRYIVSGLDPETSYRFAATVSNVIGRSRPPLYTSAVTTLGPPSKPTTPVINATTIQTLTFSFSVDFGSSPIRYFLLNITEYPSGSPNTLNISADDTSGIIQSLTMFERRQTISAYHVEMRLSSQLNNQADYVFAVAAENNISIGEFSNASSPARLEDARALYGIIGGVVGGLLLVVIIILVVITILAVSKKKKKKTEKMNISVSYGTRPSTATETDEFVLQSPPLGKSAKGNDYQEQQREDPPSPYYNCLSKYQNGFKEQLLQDPGVDLPDTGVKYFRHNPRPVINPAYNDHTPVNLGQPSPKSPQQTSLPRSLTNYQQGNGHTGNKQYPESVLSDKQLSISTAPLINDRYTDSLPKSAASYMTDV